MIQKITSKDNAKVKHAFSLHQNKYRNEYQEFLVEGIKAIELGLEKNLIKEVFTVEKLYDFPNEIPQYIVNEEVLKKISSTTNPEGIVAVASYPKLDKTKYKRVVYLDQINDPGTLGTLIRTSLAFGYDAVILSKNTVSPYNEKAIAASKGAIFKIPVFFDELTKFYDDQKLIVSTLSSDSVSLKDYKKCDKFIVVLGNEANGVSKEIVEKADVKIKIDIQNIDSLNVAIAGGILLYTLI